ncbi:olfactory receptor 2G3-like [Bombina bombina]|uniref:olfactory receptor 2G3-like n=1 Tax=Bombina bombina TaxID=8345 RepID=UPI00235A8D3E|nr:olfactory receptor 2G3-like [Bombina bombina]
MDQSNQTSANIFYLLKLTNIPNLQPLCFFLFLFMYIITLSGNILLIIVVGVNTQLQTPMYFFLCNLSFIDICFSSSIVPKILVNTLSVDTSISLLGCAFQMYISLVLGATECIILSVMAYDRYVAICSPLHYNTIMNKKFCIYLAAGSWTVCFMNSAIHVFFTFQLPYCRSHHVNHFFCEMPPFFTLSCRDTWMNELLMYISTGIIAMCPFIAIIVSYIYIISAILKIKSSKSRHKTFSTCASHIIVVSLYYSTIMVMYLHSHSSYSPKTDNIISVLYTTVTPMMNPIIYSIRNTEVKNTIKRNLQSNLLYKNNKKCIFY